jgi:hypothetical protein
VREVLFATVAGLLFSVAVISSGRDCWYGGRGCGGGTLRRVSQPRCRLRAASNSSLLPKEGDSVSVNGFTGNCAAGDVVLRGSQGRPAW